MVNTRRQPVSYRKFKARPLTPEGLLPVAREGGDLERRVAEGLRGLAAQAGVFADREVQRAAETQGSLDALAATPERVAVAPGSRPEAPSEIRDLITRVAQETGEDPETWLTFASIESAYNPKAFNKGSKAAGLFQFIPSTAQQYGLTDPFDPEANLRAAIKLKNDNAKVLRKSLGREPTVGELYLAHQQGAGGASKLLSRPNALAKDVVGLQAVLQNGGTEDMSAQSFANLWMAKASPAGTILSGRSGAPALKSGSGIRSTAYNQSYQKTYLARLDQVRADEQQQIYEQYKDDPELLQQAFGELKTKHLRDDVLPEIAADYTVDFDRSASRYVTQARADVEKRQREQDQADFESRTVDLEEKKAQYLAGFDPDVEGSDERLQELQSSIDAQYDEAVSRGILSETDAREAKARSMRETAVSFHVRQADKMTAADVAEYRTQLRKDYAAGELDGVDGDGFDQIDRTLAKLEKDRQTEGRRARDDLRRQGDDMARRHLDGETVPKNEIADFQLNITKAPDGREIGQSALRRLRVAELLKTQPLAVVRQNIEKLVTREDGTVDTDDLAFARGLIERQETALKQDPLKIAERYGTVPPVAGILDQAQASGAASAVAARVDAAEAIADHFGVPPKYFTGNEPAAIRDAIRQDPDAGLGLVAGIVEAGGDKAGAMLRELRDTAPEAEYAGVVLALGGSPRAAQDAILGSIPDVDGKLPERAVSKNRAQITGEVMGGALSQLHPEDRGRVEASAVAIASRRAQVAGVAKDSPEAQEIYRQALNEAAGAVNGVDGQLGGFGEINGDTVLLPPGMSVDMVEDVLESITDADLEAIGAPLSPLAEFGVKVTADDIRDGTLLAVAPGIYRVAREHGGRVDFIGDPEGGFWELDVRKLQRTIDMRRIGNATSGGGGY